MRRSHAASLCSPCPGITAASACRRAWDVASRLCSIAVARRGIVSPRRGRVTARFRTRGIIMLLGAQTVRPASGGPPSATPERISHDKNETRRCCSHRSRSGRRAIRRKRAADVRNGCTTQHDWKLRSTSTARRGIWKLRTDGRDRYGAVDRNVQPALRRCDQLGPHLEQHQSSDQVETAIGRLTPLARAPCGRALRPAARAYRRAPARRTAARSASARRWRHAASPRCGRRSGRRRADRE
jgi:hypothetical protein